VSRPAGPHRDPRLDELFVRYWDNALTEAETAELERRLASDPADRDWFRLLTLQAVAAAELSAVARAEAGPPPAEPVPAGRWSRRRVLGYLGAGLAASVAVGVFGRRWWLPEPAPGPAPVRLAFVHGEVKVLAGDGAAVAAGRPVPLGGTVSTHGPSSAAVLAFADGTSVALAGDSVLTVAGTSRWLLLRQGNATADVPPQPEGADPFVLATAAATLTGLGGAVATLGYAARAATEVGVYQGQVTVSAPSGERLAVVGKGEMLTVGADGDHRKQPIPTTPDEFAWDLSRPLPDGWRVGRREVAVDGPVVRPEFWFDPYHQARMSQIRSNHQWARGFFRLHPESVVRVRYRAERAGPGQVCFCVRTTDTRAPDTGMAEYNGGFAATDPGEWKWLEVQAADMFDNVNAPKFGPPWVGFLVIFNTYKDDIGLKVAEFRVTRPGGTDR
jgi:ferric-dicitrate binding protein FerR (iron transport regulator)